MFTVIITAAGSGTRAKLNMNKALFKFDDGKTVLEKSLIAFSSLDGVEKFIVTASPADKKTYVDLLAPYGDNIIVVDGGDTRLKSVKSALAHADGKYVLIHDAARPFISEKLIKRVANGVIAAHSAVPVLPFTDSLGFGDGRIESVKRSSLYILQTPQAFETSLIKKAYSLIEDETLFTDDSGVYAKYIAPANIVEGEKTNIKLTYPEDFIQKRTRIGTGFDLHRLVNGRKLILGGVEIPHDKGLLGHSDADALTHAVMDALLSGVSERDIGYHFPDTDPAYKGANSMKLLEKVLAIVKKSGYKPVNVTAVIMAEKPKLMKFVPKITENLAAALGLLPKDVGITCTTLEGLGIIGEEAAIAVRCYLLLESI
ncbi:MAG: 2-C-methyl-D-erythritol 2,4-cyclodiphosphate synthase [Clostridia bacterium]|nr:2-C-methyl-D-erythritol 2,4-cyclodiphosphate synthase [Clostridia bacterium]